jgi:hypothetical protein
MGKRELFHCVPTAPIKPRENTVYSKKYIKKKKEMEVTGIRCLYVKTCPSLFKLSRMFQVALLNSDYF